MGPNQVAKSIWLRVIQPRQSVDRTGVTNNIVRTGFRSRSGIDLIHEPTVLSTNALQITSCKSNGPTDLGQQ